MKHKTPGILPSISWLNSHGYQGLVCMMRGHPDAFAHIKQHSKRGRSPKEWLAIAERLVKENGGVLPNQNWLRSHKYFGLAKAIIEHSKLFRHIIQDRKDGRQLTEWVTIAERLAKEHGGRLPSHECLRLQGWAGLTQIMRKVPCSFAHLSQDSARRTTSEWVTIAKRLAGRNKGLLPSNKWLIDNGYNGLSQSKRRHPAVFVGIKQEASARYSPQGKERRGRRLRDLEPAEWAKIAKDLAKNNRGILPGSVWLVRNGYSNIFHFLNKYPDLFRGIRRMCKGKRSLSQSIVDAKLLARENGGMVPGYQWLVDHDYRHVYNAMKHHPEAFKRVRKKTGRGRTHQDWVKVADQLSKDNGGELPTYLWLHQNGYAGLYNAIRREPLLFRHIQRGRRGKQSEHWVKVAKELVRQHGKLPTYTWLHQNGYAGIYHAMKRRPELFQFDREKIGRSPQQWVQIAKVLFKTHRRIPPRSWLSANGYSGLGYAMSQHPKLFAHLKP